MEFQYKSLKEFLIFSPKISKILKKTMLIFKDVQGGVLPKQ